MRIADDHVASCIDAQAAGPAVAVVGGGPGDVEVFAVAVEDLDARGPIDDVEAVIGADGNGARLDELAALDAAFAPDKLRHAARAAAAHQHDEHEHREKAMPRKSDAAPRHVAASLKCSPVSYQVRARNASGFPFLPLAAVC